jgi:23S rRNA-/tRNA-specific pseudouridylate synthase
MSFTLVSNTQTSPTLNRHLVGKTTTGLAALPPTEESEVLKQQKKEPYVFNGTVTILDRGEHYVVVAKPPTVICHHSEWSGSRSKKRTVPEVPMLQRTREAVQERVNLVHRLDRGASGCLLLTMAKSDLDELNATATLQEAMTEANKTYVALVRTQQHSFGLLLVKIMIMGSWIDLELAWSCAGQKLEGGTKFVVT